MNNGCPVVHFEIRRVLFDILLFVVAAYFPDIASGYIPSEMTSPVGLK